MNTNAELRTPGQAQAWSSGTAHANMFTTAKQASRISTVAHHAATTASPWPFPRRTRRRSPEPGPTESTPLTCTDKFSAHATSPSGRGATATPIVGASRAIDPAAKHQLTHETETPSGTRQAARRAVTDSTRPSRSSWVRTSSIASGGLVRESAICRTDAATARISMCTWSRTNASGDLASISHG
jgi:hypothetical protein